MAYSRYATEMKDGDNNIYGLMDEEAREQLSDLNSALSGAVKPDNINNKYNLLTRGNVLPMSLFAWEYGGLADATGEKSNDVHYRLHSDKFSATANTNYKVVGTGYFEVFQYNSNKEFISKVVSGWKTPPYLFTTNSSTAYLRFLLKKDSAGTGEFDSDDIANIDMACIPTTNDLDTELKKTEKLISDLEETNDIIDYVTEKTVNRYNPLDTIIGTNHTGTSGLPQRAISAAYQVGVEGITISAKAIPTNLKYEIYGYSDANFSDPSSLSRGWVTSTDKEYSFTQPSYIRILFGSVNQNNLTDADFVGLKLQIENGMEATSYIPSLIANDSRAREMAEEATVVIENSLNIFNPTIHIGMGVDGSSKPKRAISGPIATGGKAVSARAFNLPSNLKFEIDYYNTDQISSYATSANHWVTDSETTYNTNKVYPYARILFGSVNDNNLTKADFSGLVMDVRVNQIGNIQAYLPKKMAVDNLMRTKPEKIRVTSFNVGAYTRGHSGDVTDAAIAKMRSILCGLNSDIIGLQEIRPTFNSTTELATLYNDLYPQNKMGSNDNNNRGIVSRYQIIEADFYRFNLADRSSDRYLKAKILIGDRIIDFFNFHLDPQEQYRTPEYEEIIDIISDYDKYLICTGDFNAGNDTESSDAEYEVFTDAGFKIANCGYLGSMITNPDAGKPLDNIVVSPNIYIANAFVTNVDNSPSDHNPFTTELVIV